MKSFIERDKKRRKLVDKYFFKRKSLKMIIKDRSRSLEERMEAQKEISSLPRDSSPTRLRNRCIFTGRSGGIRTKYGVSRIQFRKLALEGRIPGIQKRNMSVHRPVMDLFTRIRNGQEKGLARVHFDRSKETVSILNILREQGIIDNYVIDAPADSLSEKKRKGREIISFVYLKYSFRGPKKIGALRSVKSYPRVTVTLKELIDLIEKVKSQKMFFILSTSQGIMHHRDAMQLGIGGQIVYSVV